METVTSPTTPTQSSNELPAGMNPKPSPEHLWLQKLVGDWTFETQSISEPGQPSSKSTGTEKVRSHGDLWIVGEGQGEMPGCGPAKMQLTLGYDPQRKRFVGTWVGSMMAHLWVYEGQLDSSGRILTLDTEGPSFSGDGKMAKYQDIIEVVSDDHRMLRSRTLGPDGKWAEFMQAHYRRKK